MATGNSRLICKRNSRCSRGSLTPVLSRSETPFLFCLRCRGGRACRTTINLCEKCGRDVSVRLSAAGPLNSVKEPGSARSFTLSINNPQLPCALVALPAVAGVGDPGLSSFSPVSDSVPFYLALEAGLWQKRKHDAVFHGRQRAQQADYTDFICL